MIELEPRLVSLFARSFPDAEIVAAGPELYRGPVEAQTSISGLPAYFRKSFDAFPQPHRGFLVPDPDRVGQLRGRLAAGDRAVIGLTWISKIQRSDATNRPRWKIWRHCCSVQAFVSSTFSTATRPQNGKRSSES